MWLWSDFHPTTGLREQLRQPFVGGWFSSESMPITFGGFGSSSIVGVTGSSKFQFVRSDLTGVLSQWVILPFHQTGKSGSFATGGRSGIGRRDCLVPKIFNVSGFFLGLGWKGQS